MPIGRGVRERVQLAGGFLKILRETGAVIGDRTTGEKKGYGERLAAKIGEADGLVEFIGKLEVQERMPCVRPCWLRRRRIGGSHRWLGRAGPGFAYVVNPTRGVADMQAERNFVPRIQPGEFAAVIDLEGHGHRRHVIADGFMRDDKSLVVCPNLPDGS